MIERCDIGHIQILRAKWKAVVVGYPQKRQGLFVKFQ